MMTLQRQISLFLLVGGLNTLFGYALYAMLIYLGMAYPFAVLIATCIGVLLNYKTTGKIVFKNTTNHLLLKFISVYVFIYWLNVSTVKMLQLVIHNLYLSGFIALIPIAALSFLLNKYLVFRRK